MPELPDVEIFRRLVQRHGVGHLISHVAVHDPDSLEGASAASLQRRLNGKRLHSCRRHGKHLFIDIADAGALAMHFGTNGSLQHLGRDQADPPSVRLSLDLADDGRLAYVNPRRIGRVRLVDSTEAFIAESQLGPDALDPAFDAAEFAASLAGRKQAIKAVLMDQTRMAGIGNIYADEILFQARLHPDTPAATVDRAATRRLFDAMRFVLQTAIDCGAGAEAFTDRLPPGFLLPQRHAGGHCPRCGTALQVDRRGGRTGYHCPACQPGG
ncbi:Fpg/Nei family DNA glycosylase [Limobrevibacterium gyesilva]|uniref:Formamidopyrimidine-DNA glycosylase catalytic domain-containing protein n=1 Tax=Limobrevibacterium gyesilva TaxID=2991712 RepID=A0AA41YKG2_9PROT|nr:DNA-formamidopyrimidine glycosylase family protein [Limobrevibacterium gyesilva]MCW3475401.1 hypothetical protein [Limobrevibacterium gyesilva]